MLAGSQNEAFAFSSTSTSDWVDALVSVVCSMWYHGMWYPGDTIGRSKVWSA